MTLFEYIAIYFAKINKNELEKIIYISNNVKSLIELIENINRLYYERKNDKHCKILFDMLFSIMFRIMKENMDDSLYKFFKNRNNAKNEPHYSIMNYIKRTNDFNALYIINYSFSWIMTDEGFNFWNDLHHDINNKFLNLMRMDVDK